VKSSVTIVDYGVGNLFSVGRAFEYLGASVIIASTPSQIREARCLVLPGVGSFANGMDGLKQRGLPDPLREYAATDRPFLGICLGMQLLFDESEEFGRHQGLGLIPGRVRAIPATTSSGKQHKIPHIGWNALLLPGSIPKWENTLLQGIEPGSSAYFVHSYTAWPEDNSDRLVDCDYDGCLISAAVRRGGIHGCQFHPEKSGLVGLQILANLIDYQHS